MKDRSKLRETFLRGDLSTQLGNLASNLARISIYTEDVQYQEIVEQLLDESKLFIEWVAPLAELEQQFVLVDLQRCLVRWRFTWSDISLDATQRAIVANKTRQWSDQLLAMSGLLEEPTARVLHKPNGQNVVESVNV